MPENITNNNPLHCHRCHHRVYSSEFNEIFGGIYCYQCTRELFYCCANCGDWLWIDDGYSSVSGGTYCQACFEDLFVCCQHCGRAVPNDEIYYDENNDCDYCGICYRRYVENYGLHDCSYRPPPILQKTSQDNEGTLYFGVELEVEPKIYENQKTALESMPDFVYCKTDGSVKGFEIVTHPFSWNWFNENKTVFAELLKKLIYLRFRSYNGGHCGIHVHLSRRAFTTLQFFRFLTFFYVNEENKEFILKISQRLDNKLRQWASLWDVKTQDLVYKVKKDYGRFNRYTAVNTQNKNTYEIRIFRGTLNIKSFCKDLEFCKALYDWTAELKDTGLIESLKLLTVQNFINYVKQHKNELSNLYEFIELKFIETGKYK